MSFIYAMNDGVFTVMSDTKVTVNDKLLGLWNDPNSRHLVEQLGMIKCIIVGPHIVVAYAGNNVAGMGKLLREVSGSHIDLEDIIQIAYEIHMEGKEDSIEFIIGYYRSKEESELISIKNNEIVRNCRKAWLGSIDAYKEFKRLEEEIQEKEYKEVYVNVIEAGKIYRELLDEKIAYSMQLRTIFEKVINSNIDESVGGVAVKVAIPEGNEHFEYMGGISAYSSNHSQIVQPGQNIIFYQGVEAGSYCCNVYQSEKDFCMYIYEDKLGIIYTSENCYVDGLEGLKYPVLYKNTNEEEFEEIAAQHGAYQCVSWS